MIDVMKMALEALEEPTPNIRTDFTDAIKYREKVKQAITVLRQAIEQAEKQEPVAWMEMVVANLVRNGINKHMARELAHHFYTYTAPPKREWVGLSEEERRLFASWLDYKTDDEVFNAIEAKLKERNNG
jgi:hypothetical protein